MGVFIADIPNSLESRLFPSRGASTSPPSSQGPKLGKAHNNPQGSTWVVDNTLGNKKEGALPRTVAAQKRFRNDRDEIHARPRPIRLKEKGPTQSS